MSHYPLLSWLRLWLYRAEKRRDKEEEELEGLRKRGDGRREMWGHQQHVGKEGGREEEGCFCVGDILAGLK